MLRLSLSLGYTANQQDLEQADRAMIEACGGRVLGARNVENRGDIVRILDYEATRSQRNKIERLAGTRFHQDSWWRY
jgi:hypothetical protein